MRTDGYFALSDLLGERTLVDDAKASLPAFVDAARPPRRAWLPWFGVLHLATFAAALTGVLAAVGHAAGFSAAGAALGMAGATLYLVLAARRHSAPLHAP